ncbi:hypothetical protein [Alteromonas flava]|uniref:hypothetical protein n=1 Tax=Alteromonas flava TaxID=2048003 RepID=UPI000C28D7E3|nr:hypothetical protein [Alteromonas flava]
MDMDFKLHSSELLVLSDDDLNKVNGAFLANIGMGIAGALGAMATYSIAGGVSGSMSLGGFAGSAVGGFIYGASGFNAVGGYAGAAANGAVKEWVESATTDE